MSLSDEEIQGFMDAWYKDFGERLSIGKVRAELERLLFFFEMVGGKVSQPKVRKEEGVIVPTRQPSIRRLEWQSLARLH